MEIVNIEAGTFREMVISIQLLKEKQRTLQALRSNGTLPFSQIDRKTYYRRQDVIRLIEKGKKR